MEELSAQLTEINESLRTVSKRLDRIEKSQQKHRRENDSQHRAVEYSLIWQETINNLLLCGVCLGIVLVATAVDKAKTELCPSLPTWGQRLIPLICTPGNEADRASNANWESYFQGDSNSLVAIAVGNAEGTRTPDGGKTQAFSGHSDPGNGVWNMGTFSYQHGANSPQQADRKQLERLKGQVQSKVDELVSNGIQPTTETVLNLADLFNQSPRAAMDFPKYLAQCQESGKEGTAAILCARVASYEGDAPGITRNGITIEADQRRRMNAITTAMNRFKPVANIRFTIPTNATITSRFGLRFDPFNKTTRQHNGLDFAAPVGTPIYASADGVVTFAGDALDGYGLKVIVDHGQGYQTLYAHNSRLLVAAGHRVKQGDAIALMGSTGRSTGSHLHFEIIKDGQPIDPEKYLP